MADSPESIRHTSQILEEILTSLYCAKEKPKVIESFNKLTSIVELINDQDTQIYHPETIQHLEEMLFVEIEQFLEVLNIQLERESIILLANLFLSKQFTQTLKSMSLIELEHSGTREVKLGIMKLIKLLDNSRKDLHMIIGRYVCSYA